MIEHLPPPLVHSEIDLRPIEYMPLFGHRLFGSDFDAEATDTEFRAGMRLWWAAFQSKPAGSLPNNDAALCQAAGFGRDLKAWARIRERALHGFVLCSDNRLYHPVLVDAVMGAWRKRKVARERKQRQREQLEQRGHEQDEQRDGSGPSRACPVGQNAPVTPLREREREGREIPSESLIPPSPPSEARSPRGIRLPEDWQPSSEDRAFALNSGLDPNVVAARFRDYWHAKPGKDGVKLDWSGTWRNWCRRDAEHQPRRNSRQAQAPAFRNGFAGLLAEDWRAAEQASPAPLRRSSAPLIEGVADAED